MKKLIFLILIFGTCAANAGVLPTATGAGVMAQKPTKTTLPTDFYISVKGGYSYAFGAIYTNEQTNTGFTFSKSSAAVGGAVGLDFNSPSIRLELELVNSPAKEVVFSGGWNEDLHDKLGFMSYALNFIPYFKINKSIDFTLIIGFGAASLDFKNTDDTDTWRFDVSSVAFVANFGVGLDIKLLESISLSPEIRYNLLAAPVKPKVYIPYWGWEEGDAQSFLVSNFQFMIGLKYTF